MIARDMANRPAVRKSAMGILKNPGTSLSDFADERRAEDAARDAALTPYKRDEQKDVILSEAP